jgi:hypothetical protein
MEEDDDDDEMLKHTVNISLVAPTCFGPSGPSSGRVCRALLKLQISEDNQ